MALAFTRISWWRMWGTSTAPKLDDHAATDTTTTGAAANLSSSFDFGLGFREPETTSFRLSSRHSTASSSTARKSRRKWQSREERRTTRFHAEDDVVMVPSDGACCLSGSESEDSDWSIGWLEPHAPDFLSDAEDNGDASFAVLVPCYGRGRGGPGTGTSAADHTSSSSPAYYHNNTGTHHHHRNFFPAIDLTNSSETRKYMEDLLSALQAST